MKIQNTNVDALKNVIGHEKQKKEIADIISWFNNSKELRAKGLTILKGILLYGTPGNGKTLIIKELVKAVDVPTFVFNITSPDVSRDLAKLFEDAKKEEKAVVVLDELDLLIDKDGKVVKVLQDCLDGMSSSDNILVIAATNHFRSIPSPLTRSGRLERVIEIGYPNNEEAAEAFKKYFADFKVKLPEDFDEEDVGATLSCHSFASIKSVVNYLFLKNGFENITNDMIYDSIFYVTNISKDANQKEHLEVAVHEAGHAVVANAFPEYFTVNRVRIDGASGFFIAKETDEAYWPYQKVIAHIQISMAGLLAQKHFFKTGSRGVDDDLQAARVCAYNLITQNGYSSCWETLPTVSEKSRQETQFKRRRIERKIERLLRDCERRTKKLIKKHEKEIMDLSQLLLNKKHLRSSEILEVIA